jgi:Rap1a immunity proteins
VKAIAIGAFVALTVTAAGAAETETPPEYSANAVLPNCKAFIGEATVNNVAAAYCNGMMNMLTFLGPGRDRSFGQCMQIPKGATNQQIARVIVRYVEARPQRMHENFSQLAVEALHAAWPCKQGEGL